jgi:hypothetical protein
MLPVVAGINEFSSMRDFTNCNWLGSVIAVKLLKREATRMHGVFGTGKGLIASAKFLAWIIIDLVTEAYDTILDHCPLICPSVCPLIRHGVDWAETRQQQQNQWRHICSIFHTVLKIKGGHLEGVLHTLGLKITILAPSVSAQKLGDKESHSK